MNIDSRYLWAYNLWKLTRIQRRSFAERIINKYQITDLFLSMSGTLSFRYHHTSLISEVIDDLKPLRIHAMLFQDSFYLDLNSDIKDRIYKVISRLNSYNLSNPDNKIYGIHLDVEPHSRIDFKKNKKSMDKHIIRSLFLKYNNLIKRFRYHIDKSPGLFESDFIFSAATGWWYEKYYEASMRMLCRQLDAIVPMAYNSAQEPVGGSLSRMKGRLPYDKWESTAPKCSKFILGIGFCEYNSICEVANPLQKWLSKKFPKSFGGLAFFSSNHILTAEERVNIDKFKI